MDKSIQLSKAKKRLTQLEGMDYRDHKDHNKQQHENAIRMQKGRVTYLEAQEKKKVRTNIPSAPSVPQKKGKLGLHKEQIQQITREEAERLRKAKEAQQKQIQERLEKFKKKMEEETKRKEQKIWAAHSLKAKTMITRLNKDKNINEENYNNLLKKLDLIDKEQYPNTFEKRKAIGKQLQEAKKNWDERKIEKQKKEEEDKRINEEREKLKKDSQEVDNFIKSRLNIKTYTNFHTIANVKTVETEIQNEYKSIENRIKNAVFNEEVVKKEKSNLLSELTKAYTLFLKQLNSKQKELEKKIAEEKRLAAIQKANFERQQKIEAEKKEKARLAIIAFQAKVAKAKEERERKRLEAEERKRKTQENLRIMREKAKKEAFINKTKREFVDAYKLFLQQSQIKAKEANLNKATASKNILIKENGNTPFHGWVLLKMQLLLGFYKNDTNDTNLLKTFQDIKQSFEQHNNKVKNDTTLSINETPDKNKQKMVFISNTTFTKINGIISGLKRKIEIEKENEIKKKIQDEYNKEIEEINNTLIHDTALHSENIYTNLHKSSGWGKLKRVFKK